MREAKDGRGWVRGAQPLDQVTPDKAGRAGNEYAWLTAVLHTGCHRMRRTFSATGANVINVTGTLPPFRRFRSFRSFRGRRRPQNTCLLG